MKRLRVLAIAAATGRIGHVLLIGEQLLDWGLSRKASKSPELAATYTQKLVDALSPDVVVTESVPKTSTKSKKTRQLIEAVARVAERAILLDIRMKASRNFPNKYEEAAHLATRFPDMAAWVPRPRRIWEPEPRNTILFEALSFGCAAIEKEPEF